METKEPKAFQVRIPADVNARLDALSKSSRMSKNKLVEAGVRHVVDGESVVLSAELGATDAREELVLAALSGEIGALKGTAQHYGNLALPNGVFPFNIPFLFPNGIPAIVFAAILGILINSIFLIFKTPPVRGD